MIQSDATSHGYIQALHICAVSGDFNGGETKLPDLPADAIAFVPKNQNLALFFDSFPQWNRIISGIKQNHIPAAGRIKREDLCKSSCNKRGGPCGPGCASDCFGVIRVGSTGAGNDGGCFKPGSCADDRTQISRILDRIQGDNHSLPVFSKLLAICIFRHSTKGQNTLACIGIGERFTMLRLQRPDICGRGNKGGWFREICVKINLKYQITAPGENLLYCAHSFCYPEPLPVAMFTHGKLSKEFYLTG